MRDAAIYTVESKIKTIEESRFYKNNQEIGKKEINKLKRSLAIVKKAVQLE